MTGLANLSTGGPGCLGGWSGSVQGLRRADGHAFNGRPSLPLLSASTSRARSGLPALPSNPMHQRAGPPFAPPSIPARLAAQAAGPKGLAYALRHDNRRHPGEGRDPEPLPMRNAARAGSSHPERLAVEGLPLALILRAAAGGVSKDEGVSRDRWILLRDAAALLLGTRREMDEPNTEGSAVMDPRRGDDSIEVRAPPPAPDPGSV